MYQIEGLNIIELEIYISDRGILQHLYQRGRGEQKIRKKITRKKEAPDSSRSAHPPAAWTSRSCPCTSRRRQLALDDRRRRSKTRQLEELALDDRRRRSRSTTAARYHRRRRSRSTTASRYHRRRSRSTTAAAARVQLPRVPRGGRADGERD